MVSAMVPCSLRAPTLRKLVALRRAFASMGAPDAAATWAAALDKALGESPRIADNRKRSRFTCAESVPSLTNGSGKSDLPRQSARTLALSHASAASHNTPRAGQPPRHKSVGGAYVMQLSYHTRAVLGSPSVGDPDELDEATQLAIALSLSHETVVSAAALHISAASSATALGVQGRMLCPSPEDEEEDPVAARGMRMMAAGVSASASPVWCAAAGSVGAAVNTRKTDAPVIDLTQD